MSTPARTKPKSGTDTGADDAKAQAESMAAALAQIEKIAPGVGDAIAAAFSGPLAPVIILGMAIGEVKKLLDDYNADLDRQADEAYQPHIDAVNRVQTAWDNAAESYGEYLAKLDNAGKDPDPTKTEISRAKEVAVAELEGKKQIQDEKAKKELDDLRKSGASSEEIAAVRERQRTASDAIQTEIERAKGSSSLTAEQAERDKNKSTIEDAATKAADAARAADQKFATDQYKLNEDRDLLNPDSSAGKAFQKRIDDADAKEQAAKALPDEIIESGGGFSFTTVDNSANKANAIELAKKDRESIQKERDERRDEMIRLQSNEAERVRDKDKADSGAADAAAAALQNKARLEQLPGEIDHHKKIEGIHEHTRQSIELINTQSAVLNEALGHFANGAGKTHQQTIDIVTSLVTGFSDYGQQLAQLDSKMRYAQNMYASG